MTRTLTVHYHRFDHDYRGVGLWAWAPDSPIDREGREFLPDIWDSYGPVFTILLDAYYPEEAEAAMGFVPRLFHDWSQKDGEDRQWHGPASGEVWLIGGDRTVYTAPPEISARVESAWLEAPDRVLLRLSHSLELRRVNPRTFQVQTENDPPVTILQIIPVDTDVDRAKIFELSLSAQLDWERPTIVTARGYRSALLQLRGVMQDRRLFGTSQPLGAVYTPEQTTFRAFAPEAFSIAVVLYNNAVGDEGMSTVAMDRLPRGIWELTLPGDQHGRFYRLRVCNGSYPDGIEVMDPCCLLNTGHDGHGMITDPRRYDPPGFRSARRPDSVARPTDAIIWEMHLRDFTIAESSGLPDDLRGKYLGAARHGTVVPGTGTSTGIDHLVELGVTHVQLLPVMDFENVETGNVYSWGFMPINFFSPDGWYATNHRDASRIRELKQLIAAFHAAGIRVILDAVFNHTAPTAPFEVLAPGYYHRRRIDGRLYNGSLCGNEWQSESPMGRQMILESCRYWIEEFGIDGFCFDLMALIDLQTLLEVQAILRDIDPTLLIYGEPWCAAPADLTGIRRPTSRFMTAGTGIGAFNASYREALKGGSTDASAAYVQKGENPESIKRGLQGAIWDWAMHPADCVQFVTTHAELCLWDKLALSMPEASEDQRLSAQMLAIGILMVSQGMILLHAGMEFARSKQMNANTYNSPDSVNEINWENKRRFPQLFQFTKGMIALRRAHPLFRMATREEVEHRLVFMDERRPRESCIVMRITGEGLAGESWREALVLINPDSHSHDFPLPPGEWKLHALAECVQPAEPIRTAEKRLTVAARSLAILAHHESIQ